MFKKRIFIQELSREIGIHTVRIKTKHLTYLEQLKPITTALKLFGVMPFTEHKSGSVFTLFSWIMLYSFSIFVCLICLLFYKFYMDYKYYCESSDKDIFNFLTRLSGTSLALVIFSIPFFWSDMKSISEYWNRWTIFQQKFESCMHKPIQFNITKLVWVVTIVPTAIMTLNIGTSGLFVKVWKISNSIMFIIIFGIINLSTGYFYINCHIFRNMSKEINQRIMELIVTKGTTTRFREHVELWCYMSDLITNFGTVHAGMFCSVALVMYVSSTITLFLFFMILLSTEKQLITAVFLPVVYTNSILMVYSEAAYIAISEIGPKLQWKILNSCVHGLVKQTQREVQDFLELIQIYTTINFGGFCDVNRQFFINSFFAVVFNLVVVFQSQIIPNQYTT